MAKETREQKQSLKLKKAYEEMVAFENERKKERQRKEQLKQEIDVNKKKDLASNFQQAEVIRLQEKNLYQAQFFYKELRKMQVKEDKEKRALEAQNQLGHMGNRIQELEGVEMEMLTNLKNTVNEHNKLLNLAKSGALDMNGIVQSKQQYAAKRSGLWK